MAALAKSHLADVGRTVVRTATEVHGGIGFTDEHDLQLWYKRAHLDAQLLGGPEWLRERAAQLQGWSESAARRPSRTCDTRTQGRRRPGRWGPP